MRSFMNKTNTSSRSVACALVHEVLRKKQPLDDLLQRDVAFNSLEKRDRAFAHALVATMLRRQGQIDAILAQCLDQKHELKAPVHDILRIGATQLLFLETPAHAAVDTSVELAAAHESAKHFKGLINAVMRRLAREGGALLAKQDAARENTPDWLWLSWRQAYGTARARQIALAHLDQAAMDITTQDDPALWAERLGARLLPTGSLRLDVPPALSALAGFSEGAWWVQDAAAALPVTLMGEVKGKRVFDLCAAPGGKTMQLAARGAHVTAVDRSEQRLSRLKENMQRTRLSADVVCCDALTFEPSEKADFVLLDAPCTATGTIRRHPDVQRLKTPEDVTRMAALQEKLLDHAASRLLAPGGTLLYSVCSLQPEEAEDQVTRFLTRHSAFSLRPFGQESLKGLEEALTERGDCRILPCHGSAWGGLDGFYMARLSR